MLKKKTRVSPEQTVREMWQEMMAATAPKVLANPSGIQYREMERAFYAGFSACFLQMQLVSELLSEDDALKVLKRMEKELETFVTDQVATFIRGKGGNN